MSVALQSSSLFWHCKPIPSSFNQITNSFRGISRGAGNIVKSCGKILLIKLFQGGKSFSDYFLRWSCQKYKSWKISWPCDSISTHNIFLCTHGLVGFIKKVFSAKKCLEYYLPGHKNLRHCRHSRRNQKTWIWSAQFHYIHQPPHTFLYETFFHAVMGIANKPTNKMLASQRGGSKKIWIQRCRKWLGPSSTQIKYI